MFLFPVERKRAVFETSKEKENKENYVKKSFEGKKSYLCQYCLKSFSTLDELKEHKNSANSKCSINNLISLTKTSEKSLEKNSEEGKKVISFSNQNELRKLISNNNENQSSEYPKKRKIEEIRLDDSGKPVKLLRMTEQVSQTFSSIFYH